MRFSHVLRILVLMIVLYCVFAEPYKCYQCHSKYNSTCKEKPPSNFLTECPKNLTVVGCRHTIQYLYFMDPSEYHVVRECDTIGRKKCTQKVWSKVYTESCVCLEEGCNHSSNLGTNWKMTLSLVLIVVAALRQRSIY